MHLHDSSSINKLRLQILEALYIKANKTKIDKINFEKIDNVLLWL